MITDEEAKEIEFYHGTRENKDIDDMDDDALRDEMDRRRENAEDAWQDGYDNYI